VRGRGARPTDCRRRIASVGIAIGGRLNVGEGTRRDYGLPVAARTTASGASPVCVKWPVLSVVCARRVNPWRAGRGGRSVAVGFGSDCSEVPVSGICRPRWISESPLIVLPNPCSCSGSGVGSQSLVDRVVDASLQATHRFFAGLPFGLLVEVVGAAGRVVTDLTERRDVQRVIELTVPVGVNAVPNAGTRRGFDRRGRVVTGVVSRAREPADVSRVADQIRGNDRADTTHVGSRRARAADRALNATTELEQRLVVATDLVEEFDGDSLRSMLITSLGRSLRSSEAARFGERYLDSQPLIISHNTACSRQIAGCVRR
jgi:hypothetical protein